MCGARTTTRVQATVFLMRRRRLSTELTVSGLKGRGGEGNGRGAGAAVVVGSGADVANRHACVRGACVTRFCQRSKVSQSFGYTRNCTRNPHVLLELLVVCLALRHISCGLYSYGILVIDVARGLCLALCVLRCTQEYVEPRVPQHVRLIPSGPSVNTS